MKQNIILIENAHKHFFNMFSEVFNKKRNFLCAFDANFLSNSPGPLEKAPPCPS
jgi:hypothetical protein